MKYSSLAAAAALTAVVAATPAFGLSVAGVEALTSGTTGVVLDDASNPATQNYPEITAILSQAGTVNGKTYTSNSFLVSDGTGSMDVFATNAQLGGYVPTVGDGITATGTYSPYHQIPELGTLTAISAPVGYDTVPGPVVSTIPVLNQATLPLTVAGYELELDNVYITGETPGQEFGVANLTLTVTDLGGNSMTLYYWPTSYSVANANLDGVTIPTGLVDIVGFDSVYPGPPAAPEFSPLSITAAVPEPASLSLLVLGAVALVARRRKA